MSTSDYLKTQTDLLIALCMLRSLDFEAFTAKAEEVVENGGVRDHLGLPVETNGLRMKVIARAARKFVETAA